MLQCSLKNNILEVKSSSLSFFKTEVRYWYYDTQSWMVSSHGRQGDVPDRQMTPGDIEWVKKYYLPLAEKQAVEAASGQSQSAFDPKAKARYAAVTASMERDDFYASHTREECAVEWRRRYEDLAQADTTRRSGPSM